MTNFFSSPPPPLFFLALLILALVVLSWCPVLRLRVLFPEIQLRLEPRKSDLTLACPFSAPGTPSTLGTPGTADPVCALRTPGTLGSWAAGHAAQQPIKQDPPNGHFWAQKMVKNSFAQK